MMAVSNYHREGEDRTLPPRYSTRPNSTNENDDDNSRARDAEEGHNNHRRSMTFHESLFISEQVVQPPQPPPRAHVVTTTVVQLPHAQPPYQPPVQSRSWTRLTRRGNRSKSTLNLIEACAYILMFGMVRADQGLSRGFGLLGHRLLLYLFHLLGGFRQVAFGKLGEEGGEH